MEPVSQAVLGAMGAQLKPSLKNDSKTMEDFKKLSLWGALGGMAPDLDYIIRSSTDPLFTIEYHRHFTHSLFFIPIGALVVSLFLRLFKIPLKKSYPYTLLGYATHGLLDAFTNYGTHLFWPFSNRREAWNCVAVVDPLITVPLLIVLGLSLKYKRRLFTFLSWAMIISYLCLGAFQKYRVKSFLLTRGVDVESFHRYMIKPTIANNFIWRVILDSKESLQFYGVRLGIFNENIMYSGERVKKVQREEVEQLLGNNKKQMHDYERFRFFTSNYLFWSGEKSIADGRYSFTPHGTRPIWKLEFSPAQSNQFSKFIIDRKPSDEIRETLGKIWRGVKLN